MEYWGKAIPQAQFLCVCVESKTVAIMFQNIFRFEHAVNCYIPSRKYMPRGYGQLGCSGFIISDKDGCFVSRKTKAYLDVDQLAFQHVEAILSKLITKNIATKVVPTTTTSLPESTTSTVDTEKKTEKILPPPSVGVDSMDEEHKECTDCFNQLLKTPSFCNLEKLYNVLKSHFAHEEELIAKFSSSNNGNFSSLKSHKMDHKRILQVALSALEKKNKVAFVSLNVIHSIADAFHKHAETFDALYESQVPSDAK